MAGGAIGVVREVRWLLSEAEVPLQLNEKSSLASAPPKHAAPRGLMSMLNELTGSIAPAVAV